MAQSRVIETIDEEFNRITAERDRYREALDTIARMDSGVSVAARSIAEAPGIARDALDNHKML